MELTEQDRIRYGRQIIIDGWGEAGQQRLKDSTVFVSGVGGLGSPVSIYLAVAGVGCLRVCDFDTAELSNLNRQILHHDKRIGHKKALSAKATLEVLNPSVKIEELDVKITDDNVDELVGGSDIIVDCMDNFPARMALNACAVRKRLPLVYASVWGLCGYMSFIQAPKTPCLACIFPHSPPQEVFPIVGAAPGAIGCLQALEVLKFLVGIGDNLRNELLVWDGLKNSFKRLKIYRDKNCPVCGNIA